MLATDNFNRLMSGSPLRYFSDADVQRYLELQRAVKSACSGSGGLASVAGLKFPIFPAADSVEQDDHHYRLLEQSDGETAAAVGEAADVDEHEQSVKSAEYGGGGDGESRYSAEDKMIRSIEGGGARGKVRRYGSASETTIASRNKIKPEPKFQRVVTSHVFSQMRKDSRLITKNPSRFLEAMVDGHHQRNISEDACSTPTQKFSSYLTSFTTKTASQSYQQALKNLQEKCRQARSRNLLLNLGASPGASRGPSTPLIHNRSSRASSASFDSFLVNGVEASPNSSVGASAATSGTNSPFIQQDYSKGDAADMILQSYLDDIRSANVDNIKEWVETRATVNDLDLPFGLPSSGVLRIPVKNLELISSPAIVEFLKSALEEFFLLDAEYHAKLEELMGKITDNFRELEMAAWSFKDSALLFHLMNMTTQSKSHQHFSSEKLCTEVAHRLFQPSPPGGRDGIIAQKYRLKVKRALEEKRDSVIKHWLVDKDKLVKKVNAAWEDIRKKEQQKEEWSKEKKVQQVKCQKWTELLEKMRHDNRRKIRTIQTMVEPLEEQMRRQQKMKKELEKSRRQEQKEMLNRFQRLKMENGEEEKRHREEIQVKLEKDLKLRQIQNRARVHLRRQEFQEKKESEKEAERRREEERQRRLEILERTKEKVDIDYHPANVLSDTHASLVRSHEIQSLINLRDGGGTEKEETVKFFRERYSFSAETLWKDTRVRLEAKLREAGLIGNSYARNVLLAMQPNEKPHLKSQIKFDD